jgi:hypothetical protein
MSRAEATEDEDKLSELIVCLSRNHRVIASLKVPRGNCHQSTHFNLEKIKKCNDKGQKIPEDLKRKFMGEKYAMTLITRYKKTDVDRKGCVETLLDKATKKPIVEFLAFKKSRNRAYWMIPSGHRKQQSQNVDTPSKSALFDDPFFRDLYRKVFVNPVIIFDGLMNDSVSCSGAPHWIDAVVENCHHYNDEVPRLLDEILESDLNVLDDHDDICLEWIDLSDINVYPPHRIVLAKCANRLNANWSYNRV